jgi:HEAT repeat protein
MKRLFPIFIMILFLGQSAGAIEAEQIAQLEEALKSVGTFEHGKDANPLKKVEEIVALVAKDTKNRPFVEMRLLNTLRTASTFDGKSFLCRQLRTIGSARSIHQLEQLLTDPELSHMARYALGRMEDFAAVAALHRAMLKTSGKIQVGIINTLGNRRYRMAVSDIAKLLTSSDENVAEVSAEALGKIGGNAAVRALQTARPKAAKDLALCIDNALLTSAENYVKQEQNTEAARIYKTFYAPNQAKHYRIAGLRGLIAAQGEQAVSLLIDAIKSKDEDLQRNAISFIPLVKGQTATDAFVGIMPSISPEAQELMVRSLGTRGDKTAARAIAAAVKSPHANVRIAALDALGTVGDSSSVISLIQAAAGADGTEKQVARASLVRLQGNDIDMMLMRQVDSGDAGVRVEMIRTLAGRGVTQAVNPLLIAAKDNDESVRREAIRAIGILGNESNLNALVNLAVNPKEAQDRSAIEQAIGGIFKRVSSKNSQARPLLTALSTAPVDAKPTLLRLLNRPATSEALQAVRAALQDGNAAVKDAAIRSLSDWPDAQPAEDLLLIARTSTNRTHQVLALRGYIRMAGMSKNPTAMYLRAMKLAERSDDKKLVLSGLGTADSVQALDIVEKYFNEAALQTEAALAAVQIADRLRQKDAARAKATLQKVIATAKQSRIRSRAQNILNDMEKFDNYILLWQVAGPYMEKGKESRNIFDKAFPPETPSAGEVKWSNLTKGIDSWRINLEATFGSQDHCAAYVRTRVWSPVDQDVQLELGSDDAIKVWLNGKLAHAKYTHRGNAPRQDIAKAKLQKGWNLLMAKVVDHEGGWEFCCRIRKADGSAIDNLKIEAK